MSRTKIVCTMGPSVNTENQVEKMIEEGMNVARFNLSHGSRDDHLNLMLLIRDVSKQIKQNIGILFDTRGPEMRTGKLGADYYILEDGQEFILTTETVTGDNRKVGVSYAKLHHDLNPGDMVLIDDGLIILNVMEIQAQNIICRVQHGGKLRSYKGLNTPGTRINLPALDQEDQVDIKMALENDVDFLAASFTRNAEDILQIRNFVENNFGTIMIFAKIENREGVENFDSILEVSDGIMVARGDLGVEVPPEHVPLLQKKFIAKCNRAGKPVTTATQMLDSMIRNPYPTRAEASDVANAIFDGTDAVMLSGETAIGRFPIETVQTMSRIAKHTEEGLDYKKMLDELGLDIKKTVTDNISYATCHIAHELNADTIVTSTQSGYTARMVSKYRPRAPIVAVTSNHRVATQLAITWGVQSIICPPVATTDDMFNNAIRTSLEEGLIKEGNLVVITAGVPVGMPGTTNFLRVETVGQILVKGTGIGKLAANGNACLITNESDLENFKEGQILVTKITNRNYVQAIEKAAALVTEEGGLTSHGAIVAINLGKPAVVGVERAVDIIKNGENITVDAIRGLIYRGDAKVL